MKSRINGSKNRGMPDAGTCIGVSTECRSVCLKTSAYVAEHRIQDLGRNFLANLQTCADLCRVCAEAMMRGSDLHPIVCGACADACACCAAACEDAAGDAQIDECCDLCLQCFDVCSMMTSEMA